MSLQNSLLHASLVALIFLIIYQGWCPLHINAVRVSNNVKVNSSDQRTVFYWLSVQSFWALHHFLFFLALLIIRCLVVTASPWIFSQYSSLFTQLWNNFYICFADDAFPESQYAFMIVDTAPRDTPIIRPLWNSVSSMTCLNFTSIDCLQLNLC